MGVMAGMRDQLTVRVGERHTVPALLPESESFARMPEVLATGFMVAIVEWACLEALAPYLREGQQTVGVAVDLTHESPTPPGAHVTVDVHVVDVDGHRVTFEVEARDDLDLIARGRHTRAIIDRRRFDEGVADKTRHLQALSGSA